jgi:hypothetical protein
MLGEYLSVVQKTLNTYKVIYYNVVEMSKKRFEATISVKLSTPLLEFLDDMVRTGDAETVSAAIRKCIGIAKTYLGKEIKLGLEPIEKEEEK